MFVIDFVFGTQLSLVEQTLIVYQAQTQTIGYETGFEYKILCLCRSTQTEFVFSERSSFSLFPDDCPVSLREKLVLCPVKNMMVCGVLSTS